MNEQSAHGVIDQSHLDRKNDYLFRISLKCLIKNEKGEILVVKEAARTWWDLPGGGMDHGEDIKAAIARELHEEVSLEGDFTYNIIDVDDPVHLTSWNILQVRLVFEVFPKVLPTQPGIDAAEMTYLSIDTLQQSSHPVESKIAAYASKCAG